MARGRTAFEHVAHLHATDETSTMGVTEVVVAERKKTVVAARLEAHGSVASRELLYRRFDDVLFAVPCPCQTVPRSYRDLIAAMP
jgi:hypothetical protein